MIGVKLCVTVSKEITQAMTDLLFELDELTDLIPEWINFCSAVKEAKYFGLADFIDKNLEEKIDEGCV